jgi:hypothetical protein
MAMLHDKESLAGVWVFHGDYFFYLKVY